MNNIIEVKKFRDQTNRRQIHLLINGNFLLGSYVDDELMNVNIFNILLDSVNAGFKVIVSDQWDIKQEER